MKKVLFLSVILLLVIAIACKKKEVPPPPPPPKPEIVKISEQQFLLELLATPEVKNLKGKDSVLIKLDPEKVTSPSADYVIVTAFNPDLGYYPLLALLKKIPLTVVWVGEQGSHLLVKDWMEFKSLYKPDEKFLILEPMPAGHMKVGSKEYWFGKESKFWKTW